MSITEEEARFDQWMEELYNEHRKQAIEEFTAERLQSFYVDNPMVAEAALRSLVESRNLLPQHPAAALIFAAIAIEVGLKVALLKPVVYGLVHSESVAGVITDLILAQTGVKRFRNLLFKILSEYGGVIGMLDVRRAGARAEEPYHFFLPLPLSLFLVCPGGYRCTTSE